MIRRAAIVLALLLGGLLVTFTVDEAIRASVRIPDSNRTDRPVAAPNPRDRADSDPIEAALDYRVNLDDFIEQREAAAAAAAERADRARARSAVPTERAWRRLRWCESRGRYGIASGNGFFGAYQFDLTTWRGVGGSGLPSDASPSEQDARALALWRLRGSQPWPVCGQYLEE